jgi:hypothetical protein
MKETSQCQRLPLLISILMMDTEKVSETADHLTDFSASIHTFRRTLQAVSRVGANGITRQIYVVAIWRNQGYTCMSRQGES